MLIIKGNNFAIKNNIFVKKKLRNYATIAL